VAAVVAHGHSLAEAIVDTVREPLVVLDRDLRVIAASRSFYRTFAAEPENTQGRMLYELGVVDALARQLDATVQKSSGPQGTTVSIVAGAAAGAPSGA
jgi:PAS domain-containing protein